jgi:hypothetical protein
MDLSRSNHIVPLPKMDLPAALHRLKVGVPATVEHSSEAGPETGKWVAETTQVRLLFLRISFLIRFPRPSSFQSFITFMDALKLRMRAKDQLHPILQELVTGFARFKGSKDWEGRSKMVGWYVVPWMPVSYVLYPSLKVDHAQRNESIGGDYRGAIETGTRGFASSRTTLITCFLADVRCGSRIRRIFQEPQQQRQPLIAVVGLSL